MTRELRWLAAYVALSRPESLDELLSIGMPEDFRALLEGGPSEGILSKFAEFFGEKERETDTITKDILQKLGWV